MGEIRLYDSAGMLQRKITVNDETKEVEIRDPIGGIIMSVEKHADRHVYGGDDAISGLSYLQLAENTIYFRIPILIPDSTQTGLDATSTGTKWTSKFKLKWNIRHLKAIRLRATWSSSASDSVIKIAVKDDTSGADVITLSGNSGTNSEARVEAPSVTSDGLATIYAAVTTASTVSGATFDIDYIILELELGVS